MSQNLLKYVKFSFTPIFMTFLFSTLALADLTEGLLEEMISINPTSNDPAGQIRVNITPGQNLEFTILYDRLNSVERLSIPKGIVQDVFGGNILAKRLAFPKTQALFYTAHNFTDFLRLYINVHYIGPQAKKPVNLSFTCDIFKSKIVQAFGKTTWNKKCTANPKRFLEF